MNRRQFLKLSSSLSLVPLFSQSVTATASSTSNYFLSACDKDDRHYLGILNEQLQLIKSHEIDWRGHGLVHDAQSQQALLFARRSGTHAVVIDMQSLEISHEIQSPEDRHFYGHGCFSADGRYCYMTENDFDNARGVISVWDAQKWGRIAEWESYGTGPHDIHLMPDGNTLVVANGGIRTHPDYGRRKLNIDSMDSSLVYLNAQSGELRERKTIDFPYLSIRHLHVNLRGTVAIAMQSQQTDARMKPYEPLLAIHRQANTIQTLLSPHTIQQSLKGYAADAIISDDETTAVLTCPRANKAVIWDLVSNSVKHEVALDGVSGVTFGPDNNHVFLSGDSGEITQLSLDTGMVVNKMVFDIQWDNHMIRS